MSSVAPPFTPSPPQSSPTTLRLLILSCPTLQTASKLSSLFLNQPYSNLQIDLIIIAGSCSPPSTLPAPDSSPLNQILFDQDPFNQTSSSIGLTSCILSQLETIVCRVLYIPTPQVSPYDMLERVDVDGRARGGRAQVDKIRLTPNR